MEKDNTCLHNSKDSKDFKDFIDSKDFKNNTCLHNSKDSKDSKDFKDFIDSKDFKNNTWSCPYYIYEIKDEFYNSIEDNVKLKNKD